MELSRKVRVGCVRLATGLALALALTSFVTYRELVLRTDAGLIARATATKLECLQDITNHWTTAAQLEQAVGTELRK